MTRKILFLLAILQFASCSTQQNFTKEDIKGFHDNTSLPTEWIGKSTTPYTIKVDKEITFNGSRSITIYSTDAKPDDNISYTQTIEGKNYKGNRVKFSGFLKTEKVKSAMLWMRADSKTTRGVAFYNMLKEKVVGTKDWKEYSIVLDIPENTEYLYYGLLLLGTGQVWIDNCNLSIVDYNTAVNKSTKVKLPEIKEPPLIFYSEPQNLDFESD